MALILDCTETIADIKTKKTAISYMLVLDVVMSSSPIKVVFEVEVAD